MINWGDPSKNRSSVWEVGIGIARKRERGKNKDRKVYFQWQVLDDVGFAYPGQPQSTHLMCKETISRHRL